MFLPDGFEQVEYRGYGPNESYIDKRRSSWYGHFADTVEGLAVDYLRPQENGSHWGCDEVILSCDACGYRLKVTGAAPFSFNASHNTQEQLTSAAHDYELIPCGHTVLCLDAAMSGIGSGSCGPALLEQYRLEAEHFTWDISLSFIKK